MQITNANPGGEKKIQISDVAIMQCILGHTKIQSAALMTLDKKIGLIFIAAAATATASVALNMLFILPPRGRSASDHCAPEAIVFNMW